MQRLITKSTRERIQWTQGINIILKKNHKEHNEKATKGTRNINIDSEFCEILCAPCDKVLR